MKNKDIYNLIVMAVRHPRSNYYRSFSADNILNKNSDFDWGYEIAKVCKVKELISNNINDKTKLGDVKKKAKNFLNEYSDWFYDEHRQVAKRLVNKYKGESLWQY